MEPIVPTETEEDPLERRRTRSEEEIPAHGALDEAMEARLMDLAGFDRHDLYERRGPVTMRGLAHLMEEGDRILEVREDHAVIRRRDGSVQTFWNLRRTPSWVRRIDGGEAEAGGEAELARPEPG